MKLIEHNLYSSNISYLYGLTAEMLLCNVVYMCGNQPV